jgi:serine/threonine protein kinase
LSGLFNGHRHKQVISRLYNTCLSGDVFDQVVKKTHYTEKEARDILIVLLKATFTLHSLGIAHRGGLLVRRGTLNSNDSFSHMIRLATDIKPQNLLLSTESDSDIKVADFGFARRVHTPCSLTSRMGTP